MSMAWRSRLADSHFIQAMLEHEQNNGRKGKDLVIP